MSVHHQRGQQHPHGGPTAALGLFGSHHGPHHLPVLPAYRSSAGHRQLLPAQEFLQSSGDAPAVVLLVPGDLRSSGDRRGQQLPGLLRGCGQEPLLCAALAGEPAAQCHAFLHELPGGPVVHPHDQPAALCEFGQVLRLAGHLSGRGGEEEGGAGGPGLLRLRVPERALEHQPPHRNRLRHAEPDHPFAGAHQLLDLQSGLRLPHRGGRDEEARPRRELLGHEPEARLGGNGALLHPDDRRLSGPGPDLRASGHQRHLLDLRSPRLASL
mmetsp:Transcript_2813/g.6743  ORF Transcript_2813/g.6743 Transcript_2813/m.6743 type:complete len:269 (-) Transcript_2813:249-1055(-)